MPSLRPSLLKSSWISLVEELDGSVAQSSALIRKGPSAKVQELVQWRNCGTCSATLLWSLVFLISVASSFLVCIQTLYSGQVRVCVALSNSTQALITL